MHSQFSLSIPPAAQKDKERRRKGIPRANQPWELQKCPVLLCVHFSGWVAPWWHLELQLLSLEGPAQQLRVPGDTASTQSHCSGVPCSASTVPSGNPKVPPGLLCALFPPRGPLGSHPEPSFPIPMRRGPNSALPTLLGRSCSSAPIRTPQCGFGGEVAQGTVAAGALCHPPGQP